MYYNYPKLASISGLVKIPRKIRNEVLWLHRKQYLLQNNHHHTKALASKCIATKCDISLTILIKVCLHYLESSYFIRPSYLL